MKQTKYLALTLAVIMMASFSGCSGTTASNTIDETENTVLTEKATEIETEEETEKTTEPQPVITLNDSVVTLSKSSGFYPNEFSLEITCDSNNTIYYTTDGSDPRTSDTRLAYTGAVEIKDRSLDKNVLAAVDPEIFCGSFNQYRAAQQKFICEIDAPRDSDVDKCTVIRAASESPDGSFSNVVAGTYFIGDEKEHIKGIDKTTSLAVISISMEYDDLFSSSKGIYVKGDIFNDALENHIKSGEPIDGETARQLDANYKQKGKEWERNCHIDFFECTDGKAEVAFSQNCGIRVQGNYSRSDLQKGFRLYARSDYGDKRFRYPVFGEDSQRPDGETINTFKSLVLRAGGNCAFSAKFNDTYWQDLTSELDYATKASRPCVVYLNGEYWGLYVLEEDFSNEFFEDRYDVPKENVVVYKGDAEALELGYKLDEGKLPDGETNESYYFEELFEFFSSHRDLKSQSDYDEFSKLIDTDSVRDYFLTEIWINNKWDWPGKNWSMWKSIAPDNTSEYNDGKWRMMLYDVEFGGIGGEDDAYVNTIKEDNYKTYGLLDMDTNNPAVLCYAYLMTNENFREDFFTRLSKASDDIFAKETAFSLLDEYEAAYGPLFAQNFDRYPGAGEVENAIEWGYGSSRNIRDFIDKRGDNIEPMIEWARGVLE